LSGDSRSKGGPLGWLLGIGAGVGVILWASDAFSGVPKGVTVKGSKQQALIATIANKWGPILGVPPDFIMAIAKVESGFYPNATNLTGGDLKRGGAWGAMQVTLQTAQSIARNLSASSNPQVQAAMLRWTGKGPELLDPELGILFGSSLLSSLIKIFGRDLALVAAAYNRGTGAVKAMIAAGKPPGQLAYVEKALAAQRAVA
jgi:soluble lytic murein transglycosylase-like protein